MSRCVTCLKPVEHNVNQWGRALGWSHADGTADHWVDPIPQCPRCHKEESFTVEQTNWGFQSDCTGCGYSSYFSIGD